MTELVRAAFLGAVQGLTEFLPVSSSGHLVIFSGLTGAVSSLTFDIAVHAGSLLAVLIYFRHDIAQMLAELKSRKLTETLVFKLLIATIPAAAAGIAFKDFFESLFSSPLSAIYMLYFTAFLLLCGEIVSSRRRDASDHFSLIHALTVGMFQALALIPGISRSGSTIVGGLLTGHDRHSSTRFSFLLAIPAIGGAFLLDIASSGVSGLLAPPVITGFISSFLFSLFAISFLLSYIRRHSFYPFAAYCALAATLFLFLVK